VSKEQQKCQAERRNIGKQQNAQQRASRAQVPAIFERHREKPPTALQPALSRLENVGNPVWLRAQQFYDRITKADTDEATVKEFMRACPPFRSLVYATFVPWFNNMVRDYVAGQKLNAGSNDLFMSVYLPYCDWFVTDDPGQERSLRAVTTAAGLETEILS
jgi:hypothetical protein